MAQETEREWLPAEVLETQPTRQSVRGGFELRPLSLGEILDRTFALYRSRFWMFAGISAVSASVQVFVQAISLTTERTVLRSIALNGPGKAPGLLAPGSVPRFQLGAYAAMLVFFLVASVTQAATSLAMGEVYLGRPASASAALRKAARGWYRWMGIALWQAGSAAWVPLLALVPGLILLRLAGASENRAFVVFGILLVLLGLSAGLAAGVIFYLRNALAVPAAVTEGLAIRPAMRRSKTLAAGTKGRIFVVLLIAGCLYLVVGVLESPASLLIMIAPRQEHYLAQFLTLVISFLGRTLVAPVALIGLTLVYFDQRVRQEALDLELLLQGSRQPDAAASSAPAFTADQGLPPL